MKLSTKNDLQITRKITHSIVGVGIVLFSQFFKENLNQLNLVLIFICVLGVTLELLRFRNQGLNHFILNKFSFLFRESEKTSFCALTYYFVGAACSFILYPFEVAVCSILILAFADPFAALVGQKWGRTKILANKSLEGSMSAMMVSILVVSVYNVISGYHFSMTQILLIGIIGAISEMIDIINDNLTIPIISGGLIYLLIF